MIFGWGNLYPSKRGRPRTFPRPNHNRGFPRRNQRRDPAFSSFTIGRTVTDVCDPVRKPFIVFLALEREKFRIFEYERAPCRRKTGGPNSVQALSNGKFDFFSANAFLPLPTAQFNPPKVQTHDIRSGPATSEPTTEHRTGRRSFPPFPPPEPTNQGPSLRHPAFSRAAPEHSLPHLFPRTFP